MSTFRLSKLHATGNDFLVYDSLAMDDVHMPAPEQLCDRHLGVGADGLILMMPGADGADCQMLLYNADGSRAEMSGNGMRCLAWVAVRAGLGDGKRLVVDTDGGRRTVDVEVGTSGDVVAATVDMGPVTFDPPSIPLDAPSAFDLEATFHGVTYDGDAAGMGNPHLVLFVDDPATARVTSARAQVGVRRALPEAHERRVRRGHRARRAHDAGVGARRGGDAVLRDGCLRRRRGRASARVGRRGRHGEGPRG